MSKILKLLFSILIFFNLQILADAQTLIGSVTAVPDGFYGMWRVESELSETNSSQTFRKNGVDLWNLSRIGDVIFLCNPFNGAKAQINVTSSENNVIIFTKTGKSSNKAFTDTVKIELKGDSFRGVDEIVLQTFVDDKIIKTEKAEYVLRGDKISGEVK